MEKIFSYYFPTKAIMNLLQTKSLALIFIMKFKWSKPKNISLSKVYLPVSFEQWESMLLPKVAIKVNLLRNYIKP